MPSLRGLLITDPLIILSIIFFGGASLVTSLFDGDGRKQAGIARRWARLMLRIARVRVTVVGLEKIPEKAVCVIASNHLSFMDTPVVLAHIPVQFRFLAKHGLFKIPLLGTHLARAGHIPVYRGNPRQAVRTMSQAAETIQRMGISLLVFPEGGRTRDGALQAFNEGAAYIAIKAKAPLIPVALIGTREILPMNSMQPVPGPVTVRIGDPIPTAAMTLRDRERLTQMAHSQIETMLALQ